MWVFPSTPLHFYSWFAYFKSLFHVFFKLIYPRLLASELFGWKSGFTAEIHTFGRSKYLLMKL